MNEKLIRLMEKACWHQSMADDHMSSETEFGQAAAQEHMKMAQECWNEYGRVIAKLETEKAWQPKEVIYLRGVILK